MTEAPYSKPPAMWMLFLLCSLYVLSLIDRMVLSLFVAPLKVDLAVTDFQLGLLFGTVFAAVYCFSGVWLARLADRGNRQLLIVAGVTLWSVSTILSAFASSFTMLVACRMGLAVGEAVLVPCAYSLLADTFPSRRRILATSIFVAIGSAGSGAAFFLTAYAIGIAEFLVAHEWLPASLSVWRIVLVIVGVPGLFTAALFLLTTREPTRTGPPDAARPSLGDVWRHICGHHFIYAGLGAGALAQSVTYVLATWSPTVLQRNYGYTAAEAGFYLGVPYSLATLAGILMAPQVAERLRRGGSTSVTLAVAAVFLAAGIALATLAAFRPTPEEYILLFCLAMICLSGCGGICITSYQIVTPKNMIGTLVALHLTIIYIGGLGIGPAVAAWIGEFGIGGQQGLGQALSLFSLIVGVPMTLAMLWSSYRCKVAISRP